MKLGLSYELLRLQSAESLPSLLKNQNSTRLSSLYWYKKYKANNIKTKLQVQLLCRVQRKYYQNVTSLKPIC